MSVMKNLGFGSRTPPAYNPSAGMYGMMGGGGGAAGADAAYAPSGYSPDAGMYDMMGAGATTEEDEDFLSKLMAQLKKNGKKKGGGPDPYDVYQGMKPVQPFSIIGRPGLLGR
jgi:hypothetical protein